MTNQTRGQTYEPSIMSASGAGRTGASGPQVMSNARSQRNTSMQNGQNLAGGIMNNGSNVPPKPPRVNQSQHLYGDSGLNQDVSSTPGGGSNKGNYRKVFKPNLPAPRSEANMASFASEPLDNSDNVDRANALALGMPTIGAAARGLPPRGTYPT